MKIKVIFVFLCMGLAACSTVTKDAKIRQDLPGIWVADWDPSRIIEVKPDGTCASKFTVNLTNMLTFAGCWQVERGIVRFTVTNASNARPGAVGEVEANKVVSIDAQKLVVLSRDGEDQLTMHRR
jgi:hypothetical protein